MTAMPATSRRAVGIDVEAAADALTRSDHGHTPKPGDALLIAAYDRYCQIYGYHDDTYDRLRADAIAAHLAECDNPDGCDNPAHEEN